MKQVSLLFSFFLFTGAMEAASLQDPVFTDSYYETLIRHSYAYTTGNINNNGFAVGTASNAITGNYAGTVFNATGSTNFTLPFVTSTPFGGLTGINDRGVVVGFDSPVNMDTGPFSGFVGQPGALSLLNVPGAVSTFPYAINDAGVIVGGYIDASGIEHGFIEQPNGTFQTVDAPGRTNTVLHGINNLGQIIGSSGPIISNGSIPHDGFLLSNGSFTNLFPGLPTSINDAGAISLVDTYNHNAAILYPDGTLAFIHFVNGGSPDSGNFDFFGVTGINNAGEIAGVSYPGAYLATPIPEPKSVLLILTAVIGCLTVRRLRS